jgi:hypothetical protein
MVGKGMTETLIDPSAQRTLHEIIEGDGDTSGKVGVTKDTAGLTPRMRAFVYAFAANGHDRMAAYRVAYTCESMSASSISTNASKVLAHPAIQKRLAIMAQRVGDAQEVTLGEIVGKCREIFAGAMSEGKYSAGVGAVRLMAQVGGYVITKQHIEIAGDIRLMGDGELLAAIKDKASRLGTADKDKASRLGTAGLIDISPDSVEEVEDESSD